MKDKFFYEEYYEENEEEYDEILYRYIDNLSEDEITKIFYKYNFVEFTKRHYKVLKEYDKIFSNVKNLPYAKEKSDIPEEYINNFGGTDKEVVKAYNAFVNREYFLDPNDPPETVIKQLEKLKEYYMTYVYVPFMSIDRIHRLKYFYRKTVCIVDTDSNILALDEWVNFCKKEVLLSDYGRSEENNRFIIINTMAYFITAAVGDTLDQYGIHSNIPEDYRGRFSMKNELRVKLIQNLFNCWKLSLGL